MVFENDVSWAFLWKVVRLGVAIAIMTATKASVTINSTRVNPPLVSVFFFITSTQKFSCRYKILCLS